MTNDMFHAQRDLRFSALVTSVSAETVRDLESYYDIAAREMHEIAYRSAALMLSRIYNEDAELLALRHERDLYKKMLEEHLLFQPNPLIVRTERTE